MTNIAIGTNSPNYTVDAEDEGASIFCIVTAVNAVGASAAASNMVGPVAGVGGGLAPSITTPPAIVAPTPHVGDTLNVSDGIWANSPTGYTYQWKRGATNVGTSSSSYLLVAGDETFNMSCTVTASNAAGSASADSNTVGPVTAAGPGPALTNLWAWLKADAGVYSDAGTTPAVNAGDVNQWNDQSGANRHFSTDVTKPTYHTGVLNSKPIVRTTIGWVEGPSAAALTAGEIFIVVKAASEAADNTLWEVGTSATPTLYPYSGDNNIYDDWGRTTRPLTGDPTPSLAAWRVYNVVSTSAEWTSYMDGAPFHTTATNTVGFNTSVIGGYKTGLNKFEGDIAEVIWYSAKCSSADWVQTKTYLADKYALTLDVSGR